MSNIVYIDENHWYTSEIDFLLSESIMPVETKFGTDLKNKRWILKSSPEGNDFIFTYFKKDNLYYRIFIDTKSGGIGFGVAEDFDVDMSQDTLYILKHFSDGRKETSGALRVFNNVFYVLLEGLKKYKVNTITFNSANKALGKVYSFMVKNKFFLQKLEEIGFEYQGEDENNYLTFKRKET